MMDMPNPFDIMGTIKRFKFEYQGSLQSHKEERSHVNFAVCGLS